jgi:hypothetical protein
VSALRLGRLPDGTRHVLILEPAVGRTTFTRYGLRLTRLDNPVVFGAHVTGESTRTRQSRQTREYKERKAQKQRERRAAR